MRADWAKRGSPKRPYSKIVRCITIWSFLILTILPVPGYAYPIRVISPTSNFKPIEQFEKRLPAASQNEKAQGEAFKKDASCAYLSFLMAKAIATDMNLDELRRIINGSPLPGVRNIEKMDGFYITYRTDEKNLNATLHYFSRAGMSRGRICHAIPVEEYGNIFIENLTPEEYESAKREEASPPLMPTREAINILLDEPESGYTPSAYASRAGISSKAALKNLKRLSDLGVVKIEYASDTIRIYKLREELVKDDGFRFKIIKIISGSKSIREAKAAVRREFSYTIGETIEYFTDPLKEVRVFFSPEGNCAKEIISAIDKADEKIYAAIYSFTNEDIKEGLIRAKARGVKVKIVLDKAQRNKPVPEDLKRCGIEVSYDTRRGLMHNKFMVIDNSRIASGSYNWTEQAEKENRENLILLPYISDFEREFDRLWAGISGPPPKERGPPDRIRAIFSPKGSCEAEIIRLIREVKDEKAKAPRETQRIDIALYYFTNKDIARELFDARENGVDVRIILDKSQERRKDSVKKFFEFLESETRREEEREGRANLARGLLEIAFYRIPDGIMHNKFALIGKTTLTGSYNWTRSAEDKNRENLIVIPYAIKEYCEEFRRLWSDTAEKIRIGESDYSEYSPRPPPECGYWAALPVTERLTRDNSYRIFTATDEVLIFDYKDASQYARAPPNATKEFDKVLNEQKKNFKGRIKILVARKNLELYRAFDDLTEGTKNKSRFEKGKWLAEPAYIATPLTAKGRLKLGDYNNARRRGKVIVEEGVIFACGGVAGGNDENTMQIFIREKDIKEGKVHYCVDTLEEWRI